MARPPDRGDVTTPAGEVRTGGRAVLTVMVGTGVLGLSGLVILAVTARVLGAADYAVFGVFWSAVFFVVAVLFGAQQESTRSVAQQRERGGSTSLVAFAVLAGLAATVVIIASSPAWQPSSSGWRWQLVLAVAAGGVGYALTGVIAGAFAGAGRWRSYAAMLMAEGLSRLLLVVAVLLFAAGPRPLAWAVVAAYPVTLAMGLLLVRGEGLSLRVADSMSRLAANTLKTMVAAASVAALVNGFPLLMSTFARGASESTLGALTLAVMLTRAPLLVPLMALQSLLITRFSDAELPLMRTLIRLILLCIGAAALLGAVAALLGPDLVDLAFGSEFVLERHVFGLLVLSSGVIAALSVTSPALVARSMHTQNVIGWVSSLALSVGVLAFFPADVETRVPYALLVGPLAGLVIHLFAVRRASAGLHSEAVVTT